MKRENRSLVYSPEVMKYIEELRQVASSLDKVGELDQFFEKSLMVFMNDGWGYREFLELIAEELAPYYGVSTDDVHFQQYPDSIDKGIESWMRCARSSKALSDSVKTCGTFGIVSCDLGDVIGNLSSATLVKALQQIVKNTKRILVVFRVPYMEIEEAAK